MVKRRKRKKKPSLLKKLAIWIISGVVVLSVLFLYPYTNKKIQQLYSWYNSLKDYPGPPPGYDIHGIDVSKYQALINWEKVAEDGNIKFAFIKATEGEKLKDFTFKRNWKQCKKYGIKRGAYHFFRPEIRGKLQAENFLSVVDFEKGDLLPVLDIEVEPTGSRAIWYNNIDEWLKIVEKRTGRKPIIYSSRQFHSDFLQKRYSKYPLWVANYYRKSLNPDLKWKIWQHSDKARVEGIIGPVDHNVFNGDESELGSISF